MKTTTLKRFTTLGATLLCVGVFVAGCSLGDKDEDDQKAPANKEATKSPGAAPTKTMTKADLEKVVFGGGFDSPEYYAQAAEMVKNLQSNLASREANEKKDVSVCDKVADENGRKMCKTEFYINQVRSGGDIKICDSIEDTTLISTCRNLAVQIEAKAKGDPALCDKAEMDFARISCKNDIYLDRAVKAKDKALCKELTPDVQSMCEQIVGSNMETPVSIPEPTPPPVVPEEEGEVVPVPTPVPATEEAVETPIE